MPSIKLISQQGLPILRMLLLEEALLRSSKALQHSWCFVNDGSAVRSIVMGISGSAPLWHVRRAVAPAARCQVTHLARAPGSGGCAALAPHAGGPLNEALRGRRKPSLLVHEDAARAAQVQVIKRFSGGGTVVVDGNTQFVTLIFNQPDLPDVLAQPRAIMQWTEGFYRPLFSPFGSFCLREQGEPSRRCAGGRAGWGADAASSADYCFGQRKFGGNAQAITKNRWLHHTSFLWDFEPASMRLLRLPARAPAYRAVRALPTGSCSTGWRPLPLRTAEGAGCAGP